MSGLRRGRAPSIQTPALAREGNEPKNAFQGGGHPLIIQTDSGLDCVLHTAGARTHRGSGGGELDVNGPFAIAATLARDQSVALHPAQQRRQRAVVQVQRVAELLDRLPFLVSHGGATHAELGGGGRNGGTDSGQ